jgi:hypothetical protein
MHLIRFYLKPGQCFYERTLNGQLNSPTRNPKPAEAGAGYQEGGGSRCRGGVVGMAT